MPPLLPIGYSVKTWSLSPYPTRFGQVEREPEPMLRIPSQWHCLMEVTARPGFHLFKTDPGYLKPIPATMIVIGLRPRRAGGGARRAPGYGVRLTRRWRETDSNPWSLAERPAFGRGAKKSVER